MGLPLLDILENLRMKRKMGKSREHFIICLAWSSASQKWMLEQSEIDHSCEVSMAAQLQLWMRKMLAILDAISSARSFDVQLFPIQYEYSNLTRDSI